MKPGTLVICIDDTNLPNNFPDYLNELPVKKGNEISKYGSKVPIKKGNIYLIRRVIKNWKVENGPFGVALCGIFGQWHLWHYAENDYLCEEIHFRMNRFRELNTEEINLSLGPNDPLKYETARSQIVLWNNLLIDPYAKEEEDEIGKPGPYRSITRNTRIYRSEKNMQTIDNIEMQI